MATINGKNYSTPRNINLKDGILRFGGTNSTSPLDSTSNGLYINSSNQLVYSAQGSESILGTAGSTVNFSLNDAYDDGRIITCDVSAVTINGVNMDTATLALNADAGSAGPILLFTNSGSGNDVTGTSATWGITKAGAATFASCVAESLTAAANLTLDATGAGTITLAGTSTGAVTVGSTLVVTGGADADAFTITAGDILISDGKIALTDNDNETILALTSSGLSTGDAVVVTCNGLTDGSILKLVTTDAGLTTGNFIECDEDGSIMFEVGDDGAVTIAGSATGTVALALTAGDFTMTDGVVSVTNTADAATVTIVADAQTTGNVIDVNADAVTSGVLLHLDTSAATFSGKYIQCYDGAADDFSVAADGATTITTSAAGTVGLTIAHAGTTGDAMQITCTALTTGDALQIANTAETLAAGELLKITNTENGDLSATPKTGNLCSITSSVTMTTADTSLDYDTLLISRSNIANQGTKTLTAAGSGLKVMVTSTDTAGTCTDTTKGIELVMADGGTAAPTGTALDIISVGVGAKALNIASASTTVSDVLITGSGAKANTKASLEVTNSGATAAGGAVLRVSATGTPAAATSYLAVFTNAGATMTNNPVAVYINGKDSTAAALQVTGSGAMAGGLVELNSTATGALGAVLKLDQTANSAAASDVVGRILFTGQDDANAAESYGRIDVMITDAAAANPDADMKFYVDKAGTLTEMLRLDSDLVGIVVGDGSAAATVTSNGAYDLTISTNSTAANEPKIVLTDGAAGDITITAGGTSGEIAFASPLKYSGKQEIVNANTAIDVITPLTTIANNAGSTHTLADGVVGQLKTIVCTVYTGDAVITPANFVGTTITLNAAGDA